MAVEEISIKRIDHKNVAVANTAVILYAFLSILYLRHCIRHMITNRNMETSTKNVQEISKTVDLFKLKAVMRKTHLYFDRITLGLAGMYLLRDYHSLPIHD